MLELVKPATFFLLFGHLFQLLLHYVFEFSPLFLFPLLHILLDSPLLYYFLPPPVYFFYFPHEAFPHGFFSKLVRAIVSMGSVRVGIQGGARGG